MKRHIISLSSLLLLLLCLISCQEDEPVIAVTSVEIEKAGLPQYLEIGETLQLSASVKPDNATNKEVSWISSAPSIAQVSDRGLVTAVAAGKVTITATADKKSGVIDLLVVDPTAGSVTLSLTNTLMLKGGITTLEATVGPETLRDKTVTWESSNPEVADVKDGVVTARKAGTAEIVAKLSNGESASCTVTVKEPFSLTPSALDLTPGQTGEITAVHTAELEVIWGSSDETIATVSEGKVTAHKTGEVTVTATLSNGEKAECHITIGMALVLNHTSADLHIREGIQLKVTEDGKEVTNVEWSSSDSQVATVSNGRVTAVGTGKAVITARVGRREVKALINVIHQEIRSLSISPAEISDAKAGWVYYYTISVLPKTITDIDLDIKSDNAAVADTTIYKGREAIWTKTPGHATITFSTKDGQHVATCRVTVVAPSVSSFGLTRSAVTIQPKQHLQLTTVYKPLDAPRPVVTWSSSDTAVAMVDQSGVVTGVSRGRAVITATDSGTGMSATCTVTVSTDVIPDIPGSDL